jgi:hypothetical protein
MQSDGWPDKGDYPYWALIRILPPRELGLAVARTAQEVARTMTSKKAATIIQEAATAAISQLSTAATHVAEAAVTSAADGDDYPRCGNDLSWLLWWLRHHPIPGPGPDPDPWRNLVTAGLIGLVSTQVAGPVRDHLAAAAKSAAHEVTAKM